MLWKYLTGLVTKNLLIDSQGPFSFLLFSQLLRLLILGTAYISCEDHYFRAFDTKGNLKWKFHPSMYLDVSFHNFAYEKLPRNH
jgi:hypothetical protein